MNWCIFLLNELMAACADAHAIGAPFLFGYLLIAFTMYKWQPPQGRSLQLAQGRTIIAVQYEPWRVRRDAQNNTGFQRGCFCKVV